jgi:hypothetical protein
MPAGIDAAAVLPHLVPGIGGRPDEAFSEVPVLVVGPVR